LEDRVEWDVDERAMVGRSRKREEMLCIYAEMYCVERNARVGRQSRMGR